MNQRFLTLCISVEDNVRAKTPETDTWRACMCVSVCQSDLMGWEEEDKELEEVEEEEEDGFIRALG